MNDNKNIANECSIDTTNIISCTSGGVQTSFEICCYNISYLGMISSNSIILESMNVKVPPYPYSETLWYSSNIFNENSTEPKKEM